jgi:hypothetical protein
MLARPADPLEWEGGALRDSRTGLLVLAATCAIAAGGARAGTTVEVLATDPSGGEVVLGRNQTYSLRLHYQTDQPTRIWVQPTLRGEPVKAGTSPSSVYTGEGEALVWFFLMEPGLEVDEVRIDAGDGSRDGTHPVSHYPVHVVGGSRPAAAAAPPAWAVEMRRKSEAALQEAEEQAARTPSTPGQLLFFSGFMLGMLGLGVLGIAAPGFGMWRWHGGWRLAAAVPAVMVAFVLLRIAVDTARDPTSHNLWPFEVLQVGALSLGLMAAMRLTRRLTRADR